MQKTCIECTIQFPVFEDDLAYYEKMGVQTPRLCPECRSRRRCLFRNEHIFYKRICDLCKKETISQYSPNKNFPVYCSECWWSDNWDPKEYGALYDPSKSFFEQWYEVFLRTPKPALVATRSVNSPYVNYAADNKNCYMIYESSNNEDCIHCYWIQKTKDCVDVSFTHQVEFSYDVDDCYSCSRLFYSRSCENCLDSYFLEDCRNCTNCIGCVNMRNAQYCIFNVQHSKEEYLKKLKEFNLDTYIGVQNLKKEFADHRVKFPKKFAHVINISNGTGNYMNNTKNCKECFHAYDAEDCAYSIHVWRGAKDCYDCNTAGRTAERVYNSLNSGLEVSNVICGSMCWGANFVEYSFFCPNAVNCFGCVALKKGKYAVLNKEYSKEEYEKIRLQIVSELKEKDMYGEFFPKEFSVFGYNESSAMDEFPLTKEEVLTSGFTWEEEHRGVYDKGTISWDKTPLVSEDIKSDEVSKEIYTCTTCQKNYKIITTEADFYKRFSIPLPQTCPECRFKERVGGREPNKLWERVCMCNLSNHEHAGVCSNTFKTSYEPDRPEILYCESCYQKEVN